MSRANIRLPLNGTFDLTGRCNLQCKMCLMRVDHQRMKELNLRDRTAEEWIDMAKQVFEAGTLELLLTGGEVMLRPDFCEIYEAIAQMGFLLTVYTNATLVTDQIFEVFQKYPPHKIGITMYGASNETYKALCGVEDGYDRFVSGFERLRTLPSLLDIRTTLVKTNVGDLEKMWEFTERHFGSRDRLHISRFVCKQIRGGICHPEEVRLSPEENFQITNSWLLQLKEEMRQDPAKQIALQSTLVSILTQGQSSECKKKIPMDDKQDRLFSCDACQTVYNINWAGRMYACGLMDQYYTEPFKDGFAHAWEILPDKYPKPQSIERCNTCKYNSICETCPANRLAETGSLFGVPEYACREAEYKYHLFLENK